MNLNCDKLGLRLYLMTVLNELNYDEWGCNVMHLRRVIARPEKFGKYALSHPLLYCIFWKIVCFILLFCIIPINTFICFYLISRCLLHHKTHVSAERLFLSFNYLLEKRVKCTNIAYTNEYWLVRPFSRKCVPGKRLTVFDIVTTSIILHSFIHSIIIPFLIVKKYGFGNIIYCLNSFEWFLVREAIDNLKDTRELYFSNQKDRWALLFDRSNIERKILLQHGIEYEEDFFSIKMKNLTTVIAFNKDEAELLRRSCIACTPNFEYYIGKLNLVEIHSKRKAVLIIGNSLETFEKEKEIVNLLQNSNVDILLKPHPLLDKSPYHILKKQCQFELVADSVYPKVDLVLSYRSTLAVEYSMLGLKVVYFDDPLIVNTLSSLEMDLFA